MKTLLIEVPNDWEKPNGDIKKLCHSECPFADARTDDGYEFCDQTNCPLANAKEAVCICLYDLDIGRQCGEPWPEQEIDGKPVTLYAVKRTI